MNTGLLICRARTLSWVPFLSGCLLDLTPPPNTMPDRPGPVISISQGKYSWSRDTFIVATVRNPTGVSIFYNCERYHLQRYRNGWQGVGPTRFFLDCQTHQLTASDSLTFRARLTNDYVPASGSYRVVFRQFQDPARQHPWSPGSRVSPIFKVTP